MILDVFTYYAQFPRLSGVISMFANGRSELKGYERLMDHIRNLSRHSRVPEIEHYVFGQSYDAVKARIDTINGIYLFLEFGELTSRRDQRNSIQDKFRIGLTVAGKISHAADLVERAILADQTLHLISELRLMQYEDQRDHPWLKEISDTHTIEPFTSREFESEGWTIFYHREGTDMLQLKDGLRKLK